MKSWLAFVAGGACVAVGVFLGRGTVPEVPHIAPVLLLPEGARPATQPVGDASGGRWLFSRDLGWLLPGPKFRQRIPSVRFDGMPFEKAVADLATRTGIPIDVDWPALESAGVGRQNPVTVETTNTPVTGVLDLLLRAASFPETRTLTYWPIRDALHIGLTAQQPQVVVLYDITDPLIAMRTNWSKVTAHFPARLATPPATQPRYSGGSLFNRTVIQNPPPFDDPNEFIERLTSAITETIEPGTWTLDGGTAGTIERIGTSLLVSAPPATQVKVQLLLDALR